MRTEDLLAAAAAALEPVLGPVRLTAAGPVLHGSPRNVVRRVLAHAADGTTHRLVLKAAQASGDVPAREEAALRLLTARQVPGVVRLLAAVTDPPVLVLADAGAGPTLADALLGADPEIAEAALVDWAGTLGAMHDATTGLRAPFAAELAALSPLGPPAVDYTGDELAATAAALGRLLLRLGVEPTAAELAELRGLAADLDVSASGRPGALTRAGPQRPGPRSPRWTC